MLNSVYKNLEEKMKDRITALSNQYGRLRAGRANPQVLDPILVEYYGVPTPIGQMASVAVSEARVIEIQPYDASALKEIEKAINMSDLGIPPQNNGKSIRLSFPQLTEESRKNLAKEVKQLAEDAKITIRNIRRDGNTAVKKMEDDSDIAEDDRRRAEDKIQEMTDKFIKEIDKTSSEKEKEIMTV